MSEQTPSRDRRQRLFHRLVGALVLAALAVILVPMLLDFRFDQDTAITRSNVPERPEGYRVEEISLLPQAPAPGANAPARVDPAPSPTPPDPGEVAASAPPSAPPAMPATPAAAQANGAAPAAWVVRVGSFSSAENATALRDQLRARGFTAFVDQVVVDGRTMSRVQVGPAKQRTEGEALRERLARDLKLEGLVVGYE